MRPSRAPWALALLVPLALLAGACGDDDDGADGAGGGDGGGGGESLTLGALADCPENPFCIPGLIETYGVDLSDGFQALESEAITAALAAGEIDVGVMTTTDAQIIANDFVVLEDDQGMFSADNILPVLTDELAADTELTALLDSLSAVLTTENVTAMNARFVIDVEDADTIATDFLAENPDACSGGEGGGGSVPIVVGAQNFPESQVLSELYAQCLAAAGYDTSVQDLGGFRDLELAAFESGDINLAAEYAASMLEFINEQAGEATADAQETTDLLNTRLADLGLVALTPSAAVDSNAFVVSRETADRLGLRTLSDLAAAVNG